MRPLFDGNTALEQRFEPRYRTKIAIYYGSGERQLMTDYSINMSTGGIFIETSSPMPQDSTLFVKFSLPVSNTHITCKTKVAWINEPGNIKAKELPTGMGLQFIDLSLEKIHFIREFINEGGIQPEW
jgi:uncharacterized protein (TIGR02266 family)